MFRIMEEWRRMTNIRYQSWIRKISFYDIYETGENNETRDTNDEQS